MRWRWAGALASATEGRSLPVTTLAQATCPSSVDKDLPVGAAVGKAVGVDIMGQLPGSPQQGSHCPLSPPRPMVRSELLAKWPLNLQVRPQTGAGLGPGEPEEAEEPPCT